MAEINFKQKLSYQRSYNSQKNITLIPDDEDLINRQFESDRGRIINSAAIRRLQQKTQVFPLEQNAAVRSRLTHSLKFNKLGAISLKLYLLN